MIKVYTLKSQDKVLAEIRTDGNKYEVFNDSSNGLVDRLGSNDFQTLLQKVNKSSYLSLALKRDEIPGILRYILDSGDVIEATTDGSTFLMNGRLLAPDERMKIQQGILTGQLTVVHKQDIQKPTAAYIPVNEPAQHNLIPDEDHDARMGRASTAASAYLQKSDEGNHRFDQKIEGANLEDMEWPEKIRNMMYFLKHGKFKDES